VPKLELIREGERIMTICNACRYCEGYCAVFPAMERRLTFAEADMHYLANLCHNCTDCFHACQYAPPHPFAVNVPLTLAKIRLESYRSYCWPRPLGVMFERHGVASTLVISAVLMGILGGAARLSGGAGRFAGGGEADFYAVMPHDLMVAIFGLVGLFVAAALTLGVRGFLRDTNAMQGETLSVRSIGEGLREALSLKYLHASDADCATKEETRSPSRRLFHHFTFYGFGLCFASTTVAAIYHSLFGWQAPYDYLSAPVVLGTAGGIGLVIGPIGLWGLRGRRDRSTFDPAQNGLDTSFLLLLLVTSASGLALLLFRESAAMGALLVVHLGFVLTLFVTIPYGKFVHGLYRAAALIQNAREGRRLRA
jgi:citrate/tricarballylate utilization protein